MSQFVNGKTLLVSRLHTLLSPPTVSVLIGGKGEENKTKQKAKQTKNRAWVVTYLSLLGIYIYISLFFFFFFLWSRSKLLLALKKKKKANLLKGDKGTVAIRTETKQCTTLTAELHRWSWAWKTFSLDMCYRTVLSGNKKSRSGKANSYTQKHKHKYFNVQLAVRVKSLTSHIQKMRQGLFLAQ